MNQDTKEEKSNNSEEISLKDMIDTVKKASTYIQRKWATVLIAAAIGAVLGLAYSILKKPTYTAVCTFVLEESSKGGALGQYAGLASLAGIDLNTSGGSGLFQGDNILELYKSRTMIEQALLAQADFDGKKQMLIDRYVDFNHLRSKWKNRDDIDTLLFSGNPNHFNRKQDSIITDIVETFNTKNLNVIRLDKKLSIIMVKVSSKDELFSKVFTNELVEKVNDFYVHTKVKKSFQNVQVLQHQSDSVRNSLNNAIGGVASAIDASPNANPQLLSLKVPSQKKQIDVQASTAVYGEIVKNLEIAKISLRQDIPLIQVIDKPVLPLANDKVGKIKGVICGFFFGVFFCIIFFLLRVLQKDGLQS